MQQWRAGRCARALEILPIVIDAAGDPRFPPDDQAARTLAKLSGLSAPFGMDIPVKGWFADLTVT